MKTRIAVLLAALVCPSQLQAQTPGSLDKTFQGQMPTNFVYQFFSPLAVQPDGKVIVGGLCYKPGFDSPQLGPRFLTRLNPDGTADSSFNPVGVRCYSRGANATGGLFSSIEVQSDGKIVLGGQQWEVPELGQDGLVRLNVDGSVDTGFVAPRPSPSWYIWKLVRLPSGEYLIAACCGGATGLNLYRLKPSGELDSAFAPQFQGAIDVRRGFTVQPDGRIVVSLPVTLIDGKKRNLIRLLPNGSYDPSFEPVLTDGDVYVVETFPDGRILLGGGPGSFSTINGIARPGLARLQVDGRLDTDFVPFADDLDATNLAIQRDGKIILAQMAIGLVTGPLVRLNTNGSRDETYVSELRFHVQALALQPDERLLVSIVDASGSSIVRLHGDGVPYIVPSSIRANSNRTIEFQITAATNRTVVVESSPDLKSGPWTMLETFPPGIGRETIQLTDSVSANMQRRFYRAVSPRTETGNENQTQTKTSEPRRELPV